MILVYTNQLSLKAMTHIDFNNVFGLSFKNLPTTALWGHRMLSERPSRAMNDRDE